MLNEKQRTIASHHGISDDEAVRLLIEAAAPGFHGMPVLDEIIQILEDVEVVHTHRVRRAANLARGLREYVRYAGAIRPDRSGAPKLVEHAYTLAVLALQSDRYAEDAEYRAAVDDVLASTREEGR